MKKFNLTKTLLTGAALALLTVGFNACKKDDGDDRDKFIGVWSGQETCTTGQDSYQLTITKSSTEDVKIVLTNVYNQNFTATATVSGNAFTVTSQNVAQNVTVSGNGSVNENAITFQFSIQDNAGQSDACTFIGTKL